MGVAQHDKGQSKTQGLTIQGTNEGMGNTAGTNKTYGDKREQN